MLKVTDCATKNPGRVLEKENLEIKKQTINISLKKIILQNIVLKNIKMQKCETVVT